MASTAGLCQERSCWLLKGPRLEDKALRSCLKL